MNMGRIGRWADRVVVREYGYDVLKGEEVNKVGRNYEWKARKVG